MRIAVVCGLHLIVIGGLRHDLRTIVHRLRGGVERPDDVVDRMFEISGRRFDLLPPRFGLSRMVVSLWRAAVSSPIARRNTSSALAMPPISSWPPTGTATFGSPRGDPAHGAAEQRQAADDAAADIEPGDQAGTVSATMLRRIRMIRPSLICEMARAESASAIVPLLLDQFFHGGPEARCLRERGRVNPLGILLALQFVDPFDDDAIVPGQRGELAVQGAYLVALIGLAATPSSCRRCHARPPQSKSRSGGRLAMSVTIDASISSPARRLASACTSSSRRRRIDRLVQRRPVVSDFLSSDRNWRRRSPA